MWSTNDLAHHRPAVLVVSEDVDLRERVVAELGPVADGDQAHSARFALGRVYEEAYDGVVVDMDLPQSLALVRFLAGLDRNMPVVVLASSVTPLTMDELADLGASVVLNRSVPVPAMLRVALIRTLREPHTRQRLAAI
ncbi:MAG TPA: hypothetical protein VM618_09985 [Acidimicrobiia bacterium]|nr:hypothetical protein [Acidimicrobiia bacterium]